MDTTTDNIQTEQPSEQSEAAASSEQSNFDAVLSDRMTARGLTPSDKSSTDNKDNNKPKSEEEAQQSQSSDTSKIDIHRQNAINAERRIKAKQMRRRNEERKAKAINDRIAQLQEELKYYQKYAEEHPDQKLQASAASEMIKGRMTDLDTINQADIRNQYVERAYNVFGDKTDEFLQQSDKYADYVNDYEPAVRKYINRPYGQILLKEWFDRMDKPQMSKEWQQFTNYEKERTLYLLYHQIETIFQKSKQQPKPVQDVPVPQSGKNTNGLVSTDDFSAAFDDAIRRRRHN